MAIMFAGFRARRTMATPPVFRCCSNAFLAFMIVVALNSFKGWLIDLDPVNVYYWLFAGILLKMSVWDQHGFEDDLMEEFSLVEARVWH